MQNLRNKLTTLSEELEKFGIVNGCKICVSDLDRKTVTQKSFDDSKWQPYESQTLKRNQGVTWIRLYYTEPERCKDLSIAGTCIRMVDASGRTYFAPLEIYVDGELILAETAWMDFKAPEVIVTQKATPGTEHIIAARFDFSEKSFWNFEYDPKLVSDVVENAQLEIDSILAELEYLDDVESAKALLPKAYEILEQAAQTGLVNQLVAAIKECRAVFEPIRSEIKAHTIHMVGHAHIDMNWFWSMEDTIGIIGRDFATMTELMEKFPDFKFSQSQCATYEIAQKYFPDTFKKIQKNVKEGRWDVTASTWVEGDLNMSSGESIARHALYSRNYLSENMDDACSKIMWCPDAFGHPATMPQVLKHSGLRYYFHTRCGINFDNSHPGNRNYPLDGLHTPLYRWKGQDGSNVLVFNNIYQRPVVMKHILSLAKRMKKDFGIDRSMFVYGVGDHGGGPTIRDILRIKAYSEYPTVPTLKFSTTEEYFTAVEQEPNIPERSGELNFVFDGCYTTHADIKWYNRKSENLLESTEKLAALAYLIGNSYPRKKLEEAWKITLFNQFHDIFDGSGVKDSYDFSDAQAREALATLDMLSGQSLAAITKEVNTQKDKGKPFIVINPCGWIRDCMVTLKGESNQMQAVDTHGNTYVCQNIPEGICTVIGSVPAHGYKVFYLSQSSERSCTPITEDEKFYYVETSCYSVEVQKNSGQITTLFDKINDKFIVRRETIGWRLKNGILNTLQIHYEEPTEMSAWTIGNVREVKNLISGAKSSIIMDGDVVKGLKFEHSFDHSTIEQNILFYQDSARIDFETRVDWNEYGDFDRDAPMLKVYFAPAIENTHVDYEIPFGVVSRPAGDHEVPALKWADIHDEEYGMALLNDSKHGYRIRGNGMELTLIRSGWLPDQKSDVGTHCFTYSIFPHKGCWESGGVLKEGYFLNNPAYAVPAQPSNCGSLPESYSLLSCDNESIAFSAIKLSEDGNSILARVYNSTGKTVKATIHCGFATEKAIATDFLERRCGKSYPIKDNVISLELKPHEIVSIKILNNKKKI